MSDLSKLTVAELQAEIENRQKAQEETVKKLGDTIGTLIDKAGQKPVLDVISKALAPLGYKLRYVGVVNGAVEKAIVEKFGGEEETEHRFTPKEVKDLATTCTCENGDVWITIREQFSPIEKQPSKGRPTTYTIPAKTETEE